MTRQLEVWLLGVHTGTLSPIEGRLSFAYAPGANTALSHSLPIRSEPFDDRASRPFFAGLLPEAALSPGLVKKRILDIAKRLPNLAHATQDTFQRQGNVHPIIDQIVTLIDQRCAMTIARLTAPRSDA